MPPEPSTGVAATWGDRRVGRLVEAFKPLPPVHAQMELPAPTPRGHSRSRRRLPAEQEPFVRRWAEDAGRSSWPQGHANIPSGPRYATADNPAAPWAKPG